MLALILLVAACAPQTYGLSDPTDQLASIGPLEEFIFRVRGATPDDTPGEQLDRMVSNIRDREEYIANCMLEQGFSYYPTVNAPNLIIIDDETGLDWNSRAFAEAFGFGIGSNLTPPGVGFFFPATSDSPNDALTSQMTEMELKQWQNALWGDLLDPSSGCFDAAHMATTYSHGWDSLSLSVNEFWQFINAETHSEFLLLNEEWNTCMTEMGLGDFDTPWTMERSLEAEFARLEGRTVKPSGVIWGEPRLVSAYDRNLFLQREILFAVASFDCKASISYDSRKKQINHHLQEQFVDQNRHELEMWALQAEERRR